MATVTTAQRYFEDVKEGMELPTLVKKPDMLSLFMYSATVWLTHRIHFDHVFATQHDGLEAVVAQGSLVGDWYAHNLLNWIGPEGALRRLTYQNRRFMLVGDTISCGGKVTAKRIEGKDGVVECELWMRNQRGEDCGPGTAVVILPRREARR